ncbi:MAG: Lipoprotein-releasing system transmembrane protein LolE [Candidatus Omnitrophica bacterium]|nr:Lipoprotein-releasing system transmembrane protein LolE [Candidatus Omnitrophota bacterium]
MAAEWFLARRYLWSRRRHPFVGVTATVSVLGVAVGVAALIVVLAVMSGFDEDLKQRIIGMRAHILVEAPAPLEGPDRIASSLRAVPGVEAVSPYIEGQALVQRGEWASGILVRGVDPSAEASVSRFRSYLKQGTLTIQPRRVVVGTELAKRAGLRLGSEIKLASQYVDKPIVVTVEGLYSSGMYDYDANLVITNLATGRELFDLRPNEVQGLSLRLRDADRAPEIKKAVQKALGGGHTVLTWMELNRTLFGALKLEKAVMFLILALIILVACLNIAGSLTLLVMDKTRDIGVLKAVGAPPSLILRVFAFNGLLIGAGGALAGFAVGTGLCAILARYSLIDLPREIYYLDRLPVRMSWTDSAMVLAVAVGLSLVSAFYPAWTASRLEATRALRYE